MSTKTKDPSTGKMLGSENTIDTPNDTSNGIAESPMARDISYSSPSPSVDQMMDDVTTHLLQDDEYLTRITSSKSYKAPEWIAALLLKWLNLEIHNHNIDSDSGKRIESELRWKAIDCLPPRIIARLAAHLFHIRYITTEDDDRSGQCAVYDKDTGLYTTDQLYMRQILTRFNKCLSARDEARVLDFLPTLVPRVVEDSCRHAVPVKNGVFDLGTRTLQPFTPEHVYLSKIDISIPEVEPEMPIAPDGHTLLELLTAPWPSDCVCVRDDFQGLMWQILRSVVTGSVGEAVHLYGPPMTGKSVSVDLCAALVGKKYSRRLSLSDAVNRFGLSNVVGAKLLYDSEMGGKKFLESDNIKRIITGDTLTIESKYQTPFAYRNRALWIMAGNTGSMSSFDDKSTGVSVRFIHIPFTHKMDDCRDSDVSDFLTSEPCLEWILYHVLHDVEPFKKFDRPPSVQRADAEVAEEMGVMPSFVAWLTDSTPYMLRLLRNSFVPRAWLFDKYEMYMEETSPHSKTVMSLGAFMRAMKPYLNENSWQGSFDIQATITRPGDWCIKSKLTQASRYPYDDAYLSGRQRGLMRVPDACAIPNDVYISVGSMSIPLQDAIIADSNSDINFVEFWAGVFAGDTDVQLRASSPLPDAFLHRLLFPLGERGYTQKTRTVYVNGVPKSFTLERPQ